MLYARDFNAEAVLVWFEHVHCFLYWNVSSLDIVFGKQLALLFCSACWYASMTVSKGFVVSVFGLFVECRARMMLWFL